MKPGMVHASALDQPLMKSAMRGKVDFHARECSARVHSCALVRDRSVPDNVDTDGANHVISSAPSFVHLPGCVDEVWSSPGEPAEMNVRVSDEGCPHRFPLGRAPR